MQSFQIGVNEAGQRLDKFLHKYLREAPDSFLYKMLRKKNITLNGKKADGKELLAPGDEVCFFLAPETMRKFGAAFLPDSPSAPGPQQSGIPVQTYQKAFRLLSGIRILYEDADLLLADKPAGMLSQKAEQDDLSLNEWLIGYLLEKGAVSEKSLATFRPSVCNRLDRNTSGLVICGVSLAGSRKMNELLRDRTLHKFYRLFVRGRVTQKERLEGFLTKDRQHNLVKIQALPCPDETEGKADGASVPVITVYEPLRVFRHPLLGELSYLEAELITGRTHQIRAQLAAAGHPLLGDPKYGEEAVNRLCCKVGVKSQLLHAYRLEFPKLEEPFSALSGKKFVAEEPKSFRALLSEAGTGKSGT